MVITEINVDIPLDVVRYVSRGNTDICGYRGVVAYCSICFDNCWVVKEARLIAGFDGLALAMPDRKLSMRFRCGHKNYFDHEYCCVCGRQKSNDDTPPTTARRYHDISHPITKDFRCYLNSSVVAAVMEKIERLVAQAKSIAAQISDQPGDQPSGEQRCNTLYEQDSGEQKTADTRKAADGHDQSSSPS